MYAPNRLAIAGDRRKTTCRNLGNPNAGTQPVSPSNRIYVAVIVLAVVFGILSGLYG